MKLHVLPVLLFFGISGLCAQETGTKSPKKISVDEVIKEQATDSTHVAESEILSIDGECWTIKVSIFKVSPEKKKSLVHTSLIQTGKDCEGGDKVLSSKTYEEAATPDF